MTICHSHCGGACVLKIHVKDGVITRIETDDGEEPQYRTCLRGRAYRQRVYAPDRLIYPMKRIGERGKGKFKIMKSETEVPPFDTLGGPNITFAKPKETFFELSIISAPSFQKERKIEIL